MDSILASIKKMLGITEEYKHFDSDLIMHINSVLSILTQIGVGPSDGFVITDDSETWSNLISNSTQLEFVKSYVYLKVKLLFDPPLTSSVIESINRQLSELEWRIMVAADPSESEEVSDDE